MTKKVEPDGMGSLLPELDANDIGILYSLVQTASIKVSDVKVVAPVLEKCMKILEINQKVNG